MFNNKGNKFSLLSFDDENQSKQPEVKNSSFEKKDTRTVNFLKEKLKSSNLRQKNATDISTEYSPSIIQKQIPSSLTEIPFTSSYNTENSKISNSSTSDNFKVPPLPATKSDETRTEKLKKLKQTITGIRCLENALNREPYVIERETIENQLTSARNKLTELGNIQLECLEADLIEEDLDYSKITIKQSTQIDYENDVLQGDEFLIKTKKCISDLDEIYELFNKINNIKCIINAKEYQSSGYDPSICNDDFSFIIKIKEFQRNIESYKNDYVTHIKNSDLPKKELSINIINSQFAAYNKLKAEIKINFIKQITYINESLVELQKRITSNKFLIDKKFVSINNDLYLLKLINTLENISPENFIDDLVKNESTYYKAAYSVHVLFEEHYKKNLQKMPIITSNTHNSLATFEKDTDTCYSSNLKRDRTAFENDNITNKSATVLLSHNNKEEIKQNITKIKSFQNKFELTPEMKRWFNFNKNDLNSIIYSIECNDEITNPTIDMYKKIASSLDQKFYSYLNHAKTEIENSQAKDLGLAKDLETKINLINFDGFTIKNLENYISIMETYINWKSLNDFQSPNSSILFSNSKLPPSYNTRGKQKFTYDNKNLNIKEKSSSAANEVVNKNKNSNKYT